MLAVYIAALATATLAVLVRGASQFMRGINTAMFVGQVTKLVNAGNTERAIKLCAAAPKSMIAVTCDAVLRHSLKKEAGLSLAEVNNTARKDAIAAYTKSAQLPFLALGLAIVVMSLPGADTGLSLVATLAPPAGVVLVATIEILSSRKNIKAVTVHSDELVGLLLRRQDEQA